MKVVFHKAPPQTSHLGADLTRILLNNHPCSGAYNADNKECQKCFLQDPCQTKLADFLIEEANRLDQLDDKFAQSGVSTVAVPVVTGARPVKKKA